MKYRNPKLNCYYGCVLCFIPRLFVYLRMRISTLKQYCGIAFGPGYLRVSPVMRLHLCAFRLYLTHVDSKTKKKIAEWTFKMLKSIRGQDQQGVDSAKQPDTERVVADMLNCLHPINCWNWHTGRYCGVFDTIGASCSCKSLKKDRLFSSRLSQIVVEEYESRKDYATKDAGR